MCIKLSNEAVLMQATLNPSHVTQYLFMHARIAHAGIREVCSLHNEVSTGYFPFIILIKVHHCII